MEQPDTWEKFTFELPVADTPRPPVITINGDHGLLVAIHPDGHLEYGEGYEPDEAARRFWDGLAVAYGQPRCCPSCQTQLGV